MSKNLKEKINIQNNLRSNQQKQVDVKDLRENNFQKIIELINTKEINLNRWIDQLLISKFERHIKKWNINKSEIVWLEEAIKKIKALKESKSKYKNKINEINEQTEKWFDKIKNNLKKQEENEITNEYTIEKKDLYNNYKLEKIQPRDLEYLKKRLWYEWKEKFFSEQLFNELMNFKSELLIKILKVNKKFPTLKEMINILRNEEKIDNTENNIEKSFDLRFKDFIDDLSIALWVEKNLIKAIISKETTYWTNLDNNWGSRWLMQLTRSPIRDMKLRFQIYKAIFEKINIVELNKSLNPRDKLPNNVLNDFETLKNWSKEDINRVFTKFEDLLKNKKWPYFHALNIIIWSIYFKSLETKYTRNNKEIGIKTALKNYNWHPKYKNMYWKKVYEIWQWLNKKEK